MLSQSHAKPDHAIIAPLRRLTRLAFAAAAVAMAAGLAQAAAPILPALGPYVLYEAPGSATICWDTEKAMPSVLLIDDKGELDRKVVAKKAVTEHRLTVDGLRPGRRYRYCVVLTDGGREQRTATCELDMQFNYVAPPVGERPGLFPKDNATRLCAAAAERIIGETGITKGYALVYGFGSGRLACELARRSELIIIGVDDDAARVAEARKLLTGAGLYGPRITVRHAPDLGKLPFTPCLANLIVSERMITEGKCVGAAGEVVRLLRPEGGTAYLGSPAGGKLTRQALGGWLGGAQLKADVAEGPAGIWARITRGPLPGTGKWTHQYANAANAAYGGEGLAGAAATNELAVQWLGRPGADFGLDRNPRMPAPLAVSGRLFHQGMDRIIALDSYNGALLWLMEIPGLRRVNMPRDASNWCADDERLYVAVRDACLVLDGATGRRVLTCRLPAAGDPKAHAWGYVARAGKMLYGSRVKAGSSYTAYWGGQNWYDKPSGYGTHKVCSDALFACDAATGKPAWTYKRGLIINTAIAIGGGRVCFVESRNAEAMASKSHRVETPKLWEDMHLVALDAETGKRLWEKPIKTAPGTTVFYLSYGQEKLVVTASHGGRYNLYTYDAKTGDPGWTGAHGWAGSHHGGHMQHPVIVGDKLFLQPCGYNLADGKVFTKSMGRREGCPTYVGSSDALFHRGPGRQTAVWGIRTGRSTAWHKLRPSCWLSIVPANGMFLTPEGGGGCWCGNWLETSLGFIPNARLAKEE